MNCAKEVAPDHELKSTSEDHDGEVKRLRRCMSDLVSLLSLPAIWAGGGPTHVSKILLEALVGMLRLDFVYMRMLGDSLEPPIEMAQYAVSSPKERVQEIGELLRQSLGDDMAVWQRAAKIHIDNRPVSAVVLRLGLQTDGGVIVAGSRRPSFPDDTETLLLSVAANQAAIELRESRLLSEQKRLAQELDKRVAQRTNELAGTNAALLREIAERQRVEVALGALRSDLAHATRAMSLGVLAASIAHEVNQPLAGIITNAETGLRMLATAPPNVEGARETVRRSLRDANRAAEVIARLRSLFGKREPLTEAVDLNEAAKEIFALMSGEFQRDGISLRADLESDLPTIAGDRVQLQQVIHNLLLNASEAMTAIRDRPKCLLVTTRMSNDCIQLSVKDRGIGLNEAAMKRLFEPFYTTKMTGMGIGLSVSQSIVERHKGRLWAANNADGPGAVFSLSLPRCAT